MATRNRKQETGTGNGNTGESNNNQQSNTTTTGSNPEQGHNSSSRKRGNKKEQVEGSVKEIVVDDPNKIPFDEIVNDGDSLSEIEIDITEDDGQATGENPKPRRQVRRNTNRKKKKVSTPSGVTSNEIGFLIQSVFALVALKGGEHWQVDEQEALSIANPLSNILRKMDLLEKVSNVSDGAMLAVACATITIPRVMITKMQVEQKKKGAVLNGQPNIIETPVNKTIRTDDSPSRAIENGSNGNDIKTLSYVSLE